MPTQAQYDVTLQPLRDIDCKIAVLDFDYALLDEISGITTDISLSVDADSDIRRTANISINLKNDLSISPRQLFYWQAGNKYWFDKYVQIYTAIKDVRTGEYVWVNQGIYCINSPSISYDPASNSLSFQAVDLMSKLTGMRNGQLEGMTYSIPAGSSIKGAVEGILLEQGFTSYILYDAPQLTTPDEINIDAGGTAYDLLTQLRDINANWEMFFDVDGVFHWQQIPSGKVIIDLYTNETGEPQPLVDNTIWDKTYTSFSYDTSFEDVKNYIEVLGKVHEANEFATVSGTGATRNLTLSKARVSYLNNTWIISFGIQVDESGVPVALATPISYLNVYDSINTKIETINIASTPITFGNEQFVIKMNVGATINDFVLEYEGFLQPRAIAFENNPDSPFYVGESTQYICETGNSVDFADNREIVITDVDGYTNAGLLNINVNQWLSYSDFNSATQGTEWLFRVHVELDNNHVVTSMSVKCAGSTYNTAIYNESGEQITLDYSQDYMLVLAKGTTSTPVILMLYYPIPASLLPMSTTSAVNLPKFNNQVRYVCSGDEYDNIYSNDLAEQRARYEVYLRSRLHDNISIETVPIYWLDVNEIIEFNLPQNEGDDKSDLWLVKSINTNIGVDGKQTITAMRYYPLYAEVNMYEIVELDNLMWGYDMTPDHQRFTTVISNAKPAPTDYTVASWLYVSDGRYAPASPNAVKNHIHDKIISAYADGSDTIIEIYDSDYVGDVEGFVASLEGVYLRYQVKGSN